MILISLVRSDLILVKALFVKSNSPSLNNQREREMQFFKETNSDTVTVLMIECVAGKFS